MDILPDSRLKDPKGTVMADWPITDEFGHTRTLRIQLEPIFCFNCCKPNGYVPREVMSFVSWMCEPCSEKWGEKASMHKCSDAVFWEKVREGMLEKYGRALTQAELETLAAQDKLGQLKLLERESPYRR
jgi:hypothetical protein